MDAGTIAVAAMASLNTIITAGLFFVLTTMRSQSLVSQKAVADSLTAVSLDLRKLTEMVLGQYPTESQLNEQVKALNARIDDCDKRRIASAHGLRGDVHNLALAMATAGIKVDAKPAAREPDE